MVRISSAFCLPWAAHPEVSRRFPSPSLGPTARFGAIGFRGLLCRPQCTFRARCLLLLSISWRTAAGITFFAVLSPWGVHKDALLILCQSIWSGLCSRCCSRRHFFLFCGGASTAPCSVFFRLSWHSIFSTFLQFILFYFHTVLFFGHRGCDLLCDELSD